jgi:DNA-binding MarR family transcriptional regulator
MSQPSEHDLLLLLHDVARLMRVEADRQARKHGLTRAKWALLLSLERNPGLSQKEIADLLEVEPISVARLVDGLAAQQLVERRPDAADRRIWRLHLLPAAAPVLREVKEMRAELARLAGANVPADIAASMMAGLAQMKLNLTAMPASNVAGSMKEVA